MQRMKRLLTWLPMLSILIGTYLVAFNVFSFDSTRGCGRVELSARFLPSCANPVEYFYGEGSRNGIGIGAVLVVGGFMAGFRKK